ncbi:MAG: NAD(P)/FAD-dependent oxidoreductase [Acidaminococcaceae bacterium]|nr:NAD(P)/FAD-dependent oxidoreductase [Acidaminococcaceae bacterium]
MYDIAIIGGGPAGLSAAVTAAVRNKKVAVFEANGFSPRLQLAAHIHNYLGFEDISGADMMHKFLAQVRSYPVAIIEQKVMALQPMGDKFMLGTSGDVYEAAAVIIATGMAPAGTLPGEKELLGQGVSYCATCDGMLYRGKKVVVISAVPHALEEVEFLAGLCSEVILVPLYKLEAVPQASNITVVKTVPQAITRGEQGMEVQSKDGTMRSDGVFIFRVSNPVDTLMPGLQLQEQSIGVDAAMATNIAGIFAAGDCTGQPWQISRATGQGQVAALGAVSYLASKK